MSAGRVHYDEQLSAAEFLYNVQRLLKSVRVITPYTEHLCLLRAVFKPRRSNAHYLQFIEAITFYCGYQREKQYDIHTEKEYIETSIEDIRQANRLIKSRKTLE
ncbi:MAG: hypothetical protein ACJA2M_002900 [Polaribacter sp.]